MTVWTKTLGIVFVLTAGMVVSAAARLSPQAALEETISGTISATRIINQNARLTGDVTCTVTGASCIQFGASSIALNLNGFSVTGLGDPLTGCPDGAVANEFGIDTAGRSDVTVQGPGLVQQFRAQGVVVNGSARAKVTSVTASTNCGAGIFLAAATDSLIEANLLVKNGRLAASCGGV
jgi:hypothetical protein